MKVHIIKIREDFADAVLYGEKTFEVRENDRGYQKGDIVQFSVTDRGGFFHEYGHTLNGKRYRITYVLNGWGIKDGYVVFSIKPEEEQKP